MAKLTSDTAERLARLGFKAEGEEAAPAAPTSKSLSPDTAKKLQGLGFKLPAVGAPEADDVQPQQQPQKKGLLRRATSWIGEKAKTAWDEVTSPEAATTVSGPVPQRQPKPTPMPALPQPDFSLKAFEPPQPRLTLFPTPEELTPEQRHGEIRAAPPPLKEGPISFLRRKAKQNLKEYALEPGVVDRTFAAAAGKLGWEAPQRLLEEKERIIQEGRAEDSRGSTFEKAHPTIAVGLETLSRSPQAAAELAPVIAAGAIGGPPAATAYIATKGAIEGWKNQPETAEAPVFNKLVGAATGAGEGVLGAKALGLGTRGKGFLKPFLGTEAAGIALSQIQQPDFTPEGFARAAGENLVPALVFGKMHQMAQKKGLLKPRPGQKEPLLPAPGEALKEAKTPAADPVIKTEVELMKKAGVDLDKVGADRVPEISPRMRAVAEKVIAGKETEADAVKEYREIAAQKPQIEENGFKTVATNAAGQEIPALARAEMKSRAPVEEPWRETAAQYFDRRTKGPMALGPFEAKSIHRDAVAQAVAEGKPVPPEVLKDYADLAPSQKKGLLKTVPVETFAPDHVAALEALKGEIKSATAGRRYGPESSRNMMEGSRVTYAEKQLIESGKVGASGGYEPSTFPVKDTGVGKAEQLRIIDKMLNGKPLTEKQAVVAEMFKDYIKMQEETAPAFGKDWAKAKTEMEGVPAGILDVGEKIKTPADTYTVTAKEGGKVTFKDGREHTVDERTSVPALEIMGSEGMESRGTGTSGHPYGVAPKVDKVMEGKNPKPIGDDDIVHYVRKTFNVPVRYGKFRHKAIGIFKTRAEVIRLKTDRVLDVVSHELGHAIEKWVWGPESKRGTPTHLIGGMAAAKRELHTLGKQLYGSRKPKGGYIREGFAEYMMHRLYTGKEAEVAPQFHAYFETVLQQHPELSVRLSQTRALMKQYMAQGAEARVLGQIDFDVKGSDAGFVEKVMKKTAYLKRRFFVTQTDQLYPLQYVTEQILGKEGSKRLAETMPEKHPYELGIALQKTAEAKAYEMVMHHTFDFGLNKTGEGLRHVLKPVAKEIKPFLAYAYARRALELHKRGINPGITAEDAAFVYEKYRQKAGFEESAQGLANWNNRIIEYLVAAGGMSRESQKKMHDANVAYIPLKRAFLEYMEEGKPMGGGVRRGYADLSSPIKKIRGSSRKIQNPLYSFIEQTQKIIATADKIRVAKTIVDLAEKTDGGGAWAEKLPPPREMRKVPAKDVLRQLGLESSADADAMLTVFTNGQSYYGKDNIVSIWRNGKPESWQLNPELYQAMKGLDNWSLPWFVRSFLGVFARARRLGATGLNPGFSLITNMFRDMFGTYPMQSESKFATPLRAWKGLIDEVRRDESAIRFKRAGGEISQPLGLDRKLLKRAVDEVLANTAKDKAKFMVKHPIEVLREIFSITEAGSRIAEFKTVEARYGRGTERAAVAAAKAAAEVTVNFRRMGTYGQVLNQIAAFYNPSVQGMSKFYRTFKAHPARTMVRGMSWMTAPMMALWWANKDETWYQELPLWEKAIFAHFKVGDNIIRLPLPFEWGILFGSLPAALADSIYQKDPEYFKEMLKQDVATIAPPIIPTFADPVIGIAANYDFFRNRPIVSVGKQGLLPAEQWGGGTTEVAKRIGRTFDVSPAKIDYAVSSYTGGLGWDMMRTADALLFDVLRESDRQRIKEPADLPVVGRLFARKEGRSYSVGRVMDEYKKVDEIDKTLRFLGKQAEEPQLTPEARADARRRFDELLKSTGMDAQSFNNDAAAMREAVGAMREAIKYNRWDVATNIARNILRKRGDRNYDAEKKIPPPEKKGLIKKTGKLSSIKEVKEVYADAIAAAAAEWGLSESDLARQIWHESKGDPNAVSRAGAVGLMQVKPATAAEIGEKLDTPENQIMAGAHYMADMLRMTKGDRTLAYAAYNAGPKNMKTGRWRTLKETRQYVAKMAAAR